MWSVNRDRPCGPNITDLTRVNNNCSGVEQEPLAFSGLFGELVGRARSGAHAPTVPEVDPVDDPATSPYPIWRSTKGYVEGNKVVWHGNVYQAKWWNQSAVPDAPIVNEWDSPWRIIGPVLPTDRPATTTTLPEGWYPAWSAETDYAAGARVLRAGLPYEAKWHTRGAVPGADVTNPWDTPWLPLAPAPGEETTVTTPTTTTITR
jgi:chitinase